MSTSGLSWRDVRELLARDRRHLLARVGDAAAPCCLSLYPPYLCVLLFRLSQFFASRRRRLAARLLRQLNLLLTGADLDPAARIGGGLVILSPAAVSVAGGAGENLVLGPLTGLGTSSARDDVGGGPGLPVLGDDVELLALSGVLGPVRVGNRVRVGPCCAVTRDIPDDARVEPHEARFVPPGARP
jgi:serine O-acetyltransferase